MLFYIFNLFFLNYIFTFDIIKQQIANLLFFQEQDCLTAVQRGLQEVVEVFSFLFSGKEMIRVPRLSFFSNKLKKFSIMSSFRATLELGGKEYDVLYSNYEFSRTTDKKGQPASSISGGRISVTIESTDDTSTIEAMLNSQFKPVEGKIVYKKSEEDAKMKEISFKNAYIVHYKETLDVNNEAPMTIAMTFSAENINVGNAELDNRWPRT